MASDWSECCSGRVGLEDHAVLVGLGEDRRDDALAERVVERVVDRAAVMPKRAALSRSIVT